jgi:hypothetical protein
VIEADHPVVETDREIGDKQIIAAGPRQRFDVMAQAVAEEARGAALERRQIGYRAVAKAGKMLGEDAERITGARAAVFGDCRAGRG